MPYLTLTEKSKVTTKPCFRYLLQHPARKRSGFILGHTHRQTCLLAYLLARTHMGQIIKKEVLYNTSGW